MSGWEKLLAQMVADRKGRSFAYSDAARVLSRLGFELAPNSGTSHRKWRRHIVDPSDPNKRRLVVIGLVDGGSRAMKPEYVKHMIDTLEATDLIVTEGR